MEASGRVGGGGGVGERVGQGSAGELGMERRRI